MTLEELLSGKGIMSRVKGVFVKNELAELRNEMKNVQDLAIDLYRYGPALLGPDEVIGRMGEVGIVGSELFDYMQDTLRNWDIISSTGAEQESNRLRAVTESRLLSLRDVLTIQIISLWTDFGFGVNVDIVPRDDTAKDVWSEFFDASRNRNIFGKRKMHKQSNTVLTDGEIFYVAFISELDGLVTLRSIPTEQVKEIITPVEDDGIPAYYKRVWTDKLNKEHTLYYRDWLLEKDDVEIGEIAEVEEVGQEWTLDEVTNEWSLGEQEIKTPKTVKETILADDKSAVFAEDENDKTDVVVIHVAHMERLGRGWPLMTAGAPWSKVYRDFLGDRAAVARSVAMYVDTMTANTGQRGLDSLKAKLQSSLVTGTSGYETNPQPVAGSTRLQNQAVTTERNSLTTGAQDARADGAMQMGMVGLAGGVFPHWMGMGEAFRLATATSMEAPTMRRFGRYQNFWSSVWDDIGMLVFEAHNEFGGGGITEMEVDVSTDSIIDVDLALVSTTLNMVVKQFELGTISDEQMITIGEQLVRISLQTLGVGDIDDLLNPPDEILVDEPDEEDVAMASMAAENWLKTIIKNLAEADNG